MISCRRPTHLPSMRLRPLDKVKVFRDPRKRMLADYVNALADLAHPKMALTILHDKARVLSYEWAIQEAVTMHQGTPGFTQKPLQLTAGDSARPV